MKILFHCFLGGLTLFFLNTVSAQNEQAGPYTQQVYFESPNGFQGSIKIHYALKACYDKIVMVVGWSSLQLNSVNRDGKKYFASDLGLTNFQQYVQGLHSMEVSFYNYRTNNIYSTKRATYVQSDFTIGCFGETVNVIDKNNFHDNIGDIRSEFSNLNIGMEGTLAFKIKTYEKQLENQRKYKELIQKFHNTSSNDRKLEILREAYQYTEDKSEIDSLKSQVERQLEAEKQRQQEAQRTENTSGLNDESVFLEVTDPYADEPQTTGTSQQTQYSTPTNYTVPSAPTPPTDQMAEYNRMSRELEAERQQAAQEYQETANAISNVVTSVVNVFEQHAATKRAYAERERRNREFNSNREGNNLRSRISETLESKKLVQMQLDRYINGNSTYKSVLQELEAYEMKVKAVQSIDIQYSENKNLKAFNDSEYIQKTQEFLVDNEFYKNRESTRRNLIMLLDTKNTWLSAEYGKRRKYIDFITAQLKADSQIYKMNLIENSKNPELVIALIKANTNVNDKGFYKNWMMEEGPVKRFVMESYEGERIIEQEGKTSLNDILLAQDLKTGKMGYIDRNKQWIIKPQYEQAIPFDSGKALVTKEYFPEGGTEYLNINENNLQLSSTKEKGVVIIGLFVDGYAQAIKDGEILRGMINQNFDWVIQPKYLKLTFTENGTAIVTNKNNNEKTITYHEN